jgi:hypothetical protein
MEEADVQTTGQGVEETRAIPSSYAGIIQQLEGEVRTLRERLTQVEEERDAALKESTDVTVGIVALQKALLSEKNVELVTLKKVIFELKNKNAFLQSQLAQAEKRLHTREVAGVELASLQTQRSNLAASRMSASGASPLGQSQLMSRGGSTWAPLGESQLLLSPSSAQHHMRGGSFASMRSADFRSGDYAPSIGAASSPRLPPSCSGPSLSIPPERVNPDSLRVKALLEKYGQGQAIGAGAEEAAAVTAGNSRATSLGTQREMSNEPAPRGVDTTAKTGKTQPVDEQQSLDHLKALQLRAGAGGPRRSDSPAATARAKLADLKSLLAVSHSPSPAFTFVPR